jgi:hypothetical protein
MRPWLLKHKVAGDKPWAVQVEGMRRSEGHDKFGQYLECGLGKTSLTFNEYLNDSDVDLMVVFAPNSFKQDWVLVPEAWGRPDVPAWSYPKHPLPFNEEIGIYAVNYEAARSNIFPELQRLFKTRKVFMVIDEATAIMNPQSLITKGVRELAKDATKVRVLNGTPYTKNVMDYYSPMRCLGQFNGFKPASFKARYGISGGFMGKQLIGVNPEREHELMRLIDQVSFRALKSDWRKDLPPQIQVDPVHVEMTSKQLKHYREMLEEFYTVVGDLEVSADVAVVQMGKLRQISSCMVMDGDQLRFIEEPKDVPKFRAAFDIHESGPGKSLLVYVHKQVGVALLDMAVKLGLNPAHFRGGMKDDEKIEQKRKFNDDPDCRVMVCQELATCRGHTLIGGDKENSCNSTVFVEQDFALWERLQMLDRNFRGAQQEPCTIYDIVTSPMDQFIVDTLRSKREMSDRMDELQIMVRQRKWNL